MAESGLRSGSGHDALPTDNFIVFNLHQNGVPVVETDYKNFFCGVKNLECQAVWTKNEIDFTFNEKHECI